MSIRWDRHHFQQALTEAKMSKDPSTQVGAVIIGPDREVLATGYNGFPRYVTDDGSVLNNRTKKLLGIVHAERNAICNAARVGVRLKGSTLYVLQRDAVTHAHWGGEPCAQCVAESIQAGIKEIVSLPPINFPERWKEDREVAQWLLWEARTAIRYREALITEIGDLEHG